jgi:hypothetical protein
LLRRHSKCAPSPVLCGNVQQGGEGAERCRQGNNGEGLHGLRSRPGSPPPFSLPSCACGVDSGRVQSHWTAASGHGQAIGYRGVARGTSILGGNHSHSSHFRLFRVSQKASACPHAPASVAACLYLWPVTFCPGERWQKCFLFALGKTLCFCIGRKYLFCHWHTLLYI